MFKHLKKRLLLIFIISIMSLFSVLFCFFIYNFVSSEREIEQSNFAGKAGGTLFALEANLKEYVRIFSMLKIDDQIGAVFCNSENAIIYQTIDIFPEELQEFTGYLFAEREKIKYSSFLENPFSAQKGIFRFHSSLDHSYYIVYGDLVIAGQDTCYVYFISPESGILSILKPYLLLYVFIYLFAFLALLLLSQYVVNKAVEPAEKSIQSQKNFIASASHELKAPLAVISAGVEVMSFDETILQRHERTLGMIDEECQSMSELIRNLLLLTSIDTHTWSLNKTDVNVDSLVISLYEKFEPVCQKNKITLKIESDDVFPQFHTDHNRLLQLLSIFMDNAIDYSTPGSEILLKAEKAKSRIVFSVIDHGPGIAEENKPFIYDRFYCTDQSRTQKSHYGLGLSIAAELADMMHGKIVLSDTPGGGCTFKISFSI